MTDDRLDERRPSTADVAAAARRADRELTDREVAMRRTDSRADEFEHMHLLPDEVADDLRPRWAEIQGSFVDAPRKAVEQADQLVAEAIQRLAEAFSEAKAGLEREWDRGEEVSTEDLRIALQRYRTFFDRLLNM
ncbi:MAG TPA: hypothetical protein VFZ73_05790 [Gemmatimonadaceae bacterium]